ncbi:MAG: efflux RND transporter periplasmic adaptor subunit [Thiomicrorhabdus chilensis]|uniref:efflux RND transporter periplasmic adaptor subunit n=1 Tax=Thiomicrorhabdus chilensis TaxID=63656 RepID=UPI00299EA757|nr:efflux RND transporter periplasmic adaptor subunit [Thiomicrorhabdus chilensis]MDX1348018.1 efflux RND transporter periplasmic adaptor subunit [Thiomicrorhabdus chilensis]
MRFFALLLVSAILMAPTVQAVKADSSSVPVSVVPIKKVTHQTWRLTGQVVSRFTLPLSVRVQGQVAERSVELGDRVQVGQSLLRLDQTDLRLEVARSEASLKSAQAETLNAERERKRLSKLYADKLVSLQELQRAETFESASRQTLIAAEATLKLAKNKLAYSTLQSPESGQVSSVEVEVGQVVSPGQTLFQLASGDPEVAVLLPSARLQGALDVARVEGVDQPGLCDARLRAKSPVNHAGSLQYQAYYRLLNCSQILPLGATVQVQFENIAEPGLKKVPLSSIFNKGEQSFVWQVLDQTVSAKPVQVFRLDSRYAYIITELAEEALVVAQGVHVLVEGQAVRLRP